jgi:uncharacterized protein YjbI with pentapeptide repeats
MANPEHLSILKSGVATWNKWRKDHTSIQPNLYEADLRQANLSGADLSSADLSRADLSRANLNRAILMRVDLREANLNRAILMRVDLREANLSGANLSGADLRGVANLHGANFKGANLSGADLRRADLTGAFLGGVNLHGADLTRAILRGANLRRANLREADLRVADLSQADLCKADLTAARLERASVVDTRCNKSIFTGCRIYGLSAWDLELADTQQTNLIITPMGEPDITVDNLEVAQFIYLLLNNKRVRQVIETITSKVVLILGRFTPERKEVLEAIRENLRNRDYLPVLFDFDKPANRDITETVRTLAHMARFIIADITDAKSIPQELMAIVPNLPSVPVQPLLLASQNEYGMFEHFKRYPWVLETVLYQGQEELLRSLESTVILPAEQKAKELITRSGTTPSDRKP